MKYTLFLGTQQKYDIYILVNNQYYFLKFGGDSIKEAIMYLEEGSIIPSTETNHYIEKTIQELKIAQANTIEELKMKIMEYLI